MVEDLRLGDHPADVGHQVVEQLELGRGERDGGAGPGDLVGDRVEAEVGDDEPAVLGGPAGAAQDGADPGDQLLQAERLGDVVVGARGEALDLVADAVLGGEEEHREVVAGVAVHGPGDLAAVGPLAQLLDDGEAVEVREHHVEDDEVGAFDGYQVEGLGAAGGGGDPETGEAQRGGEQLADVGFVVDDEEEGLARAAGHRGPAWCGDCALHGAFASWSDDGIRHEASPRRLCGIDECWINTLSVGFFSTRPPAQAGWYAHGR